MARRKTTPCEFCEQEWFQNVDMRNVSVAVEVYPENTHIAINIQGIDDDGGMTGEESLDIPMEYCPNCGRKLGW